MTGEKVASSYSNRVDTYWKEIRLSFSMIRIALPTYYLPTKQQLLSLSFLFDILPSSTVFLPILSSHWNLLPGRGNLFNYFLRALKFKSIFISLFLLIRNARVMDSIFVSIEFQYKNHITGKCFFLICWRDAGRIHIHSVSSLWGSCVYGRKPINIRLKFYMIFIARSRRGIAMVFCIILISTVQRVSERRIILL